MSTLNSCCCTATNPPTRDSGHRLVVNSTPEPGSHPCNAPFAKQEKRQVLISNPSNSIGRVVLLVVAAAVAGYFAPRPGPPVVATSVDLLEVPELV